MRLHVRSGSAVSTPIKTILVLLVVVAATALPSTANASGTGHHRSGHAAIAGTVVGLNEDPGHESSGPLAAAKVTVVDAHNGKRLGTTLTGADGRFVIGSLPAKHVKVKVTKAGYLTGWGDDEKSFWAADEYRLKNRRTVTIANPIVLSAAATISGQVLGGFDPVSYANVAVFNADTGRRLKTQVTDVSGYYTITGLPAGNIKVRARLAGYGDDWASHKPDWATADVYNLKAGQHLSQTWDAELILYLDLREPVVLPPTVSARR